MKKTNKKLIIILAVVSLLAIGGIMISNRNTESTEVVVAQTQGPTVARIDVLTTPYTETPNIAVYNETEEELKEVSWMKNINSRGYVVQKNGSNNNFTINVINDTDIKLVLRGPDKRDDDGKFIESWVDFTSVTVNGEEVLSDTVAVWHNKPFTYVINAKTGETYKVEAKWQKHEDIKVSE